jgi:hypothetical protein
MTVAVPPGAPGYDADAPAPSAPAAGQPAPPAPPAPPADAALPTALDVPRDTTPTFELEMLVSGAILFLLFQVPPAIDGLVARWEVHLGLLGIFLGAGIGMIGTAAVYSLIACFVTHLFLRGYWAALVGVHSVFPGGVRWERMKESGPQSRAILRERIRPMPQFIARLDNAASLVFATGFVLSMGSLSGALVIAVAGLLMSGIVALGVGRPEIVLLATLVPLALLYMSLPIIDYKFGERVRGRPARWLRAALGTMLRLQPASLSTLSFTLTTNVDKRVAYAVLFIGAGASTAVAMGERLSDGDVPGGGRYEFFDDEQETRAVHAHFYDSLRGEAASERAPSIQSEVVTGPYVRLFVPYILMRHGDALRSACPGLQPLQDLGLEGAPADGAADAVLRCALKVHRPALDGRPLDAHGFRFYADPRSNRRGFVMFVPTAGLAPGEHRLTVWPAVGRGRTPPKTPYTIPFWR